ncbi:hypothetical protein [Hallella colorans]|uniref:hypothetical protein n=1 Tax=Hallella colorans TaxID=1703337 RepID=UPI0023F07F0C|nr:hypothetical protein [Hallella colorans]
MMIFRKIFVAIFIVITIVSCKRQAADTTNINDPFAGDYRMAGDSTVYGLACKGSSDDAILLLPADGSDPVRYDIVLATRRNKVLGSINTGDRIALVPNKKHANVADMVINLDELKGVWCYMVMPQMRQDSYKQEQVQDRTKDSMADSLALSLFVPLEYGFWLKSQGEAASVGYIRELNTLVDESPVIYPSLDYFIKWQIWNGKFILASGKPKYDKDNTVDGYTDIRYDTCSIDFLSHDSLALTDRNGTRCYYRKKDANEVNKKAQTIADKHKKAALRRNAQP